MTVWFVNVCQASCDEKLRANGRSAAGIFIGAHVVRFFNKNNLHRHQRGRIRFLGLPARTTALCRPKLKNKLSAPTAITNCANLGLLGRLQFAASASTMSKSMNMLRTRRRDNNVKPNRRLDRKSSRGMIYENEELRLKTININAEIERGQSDIKKLKRENEMLKKEIWCLRDEYEKLDKMLKEKDINFSASSTTCTSDSDSCSSCSEDSDQVETSQNLENVQKTNLKNLHVEFDHLSVVPEENSTENSDKNSNRVSVPNDSWCSDKQHVIKPDQSYPSFETLSKASTLPVQQERNPKHFFAPLKPSRSCEDCLNNEYYPPIYSCGSRYYQPFVGQNFCPPPPTTKVHPIYENLNVIPSLSKSGTDLIVKTDNHSFKTMTNSSSFSNGGNLEELLNDIESISQDILKLSNPNLHNGDIHGSKMLPSKENFQQQQQVNGKSETNQNRPYKSELNVVLMPTPMPLLGFEKYRNIPQLGGGENVQQAKSLENLPNDLFYPPENLQTPVPFLAQSPNLMVTGGQPTNENPFFFGNFKDSGSSDLFNARYNPDNYLNKGRELDGKDKLKKSEICNSKTNLLELSSGHVSSENEENLKFKTSNNDIEEEKLQQKINQEKKGGAEVKSPKMSIRRKVSIHFKGKKDKNVKNSKNAENLDTPTTPSDKKHSIFDIKFSLEGKQKPDHQKTSSIDSKSSNLDQPKTPSSADTTKRNSSNEPKTPCIIDGKLDRMSSTEGKPPDAAKSQEKKPRKSASVSPDRKHVHVKEEAKKSHKKHKKANDKLRNRRSTISNERFHRERSFSVCTDRSNILGSGFNPGFSMSDDFVGHSDRERTNSISSCGTIKMRKMSNMSNFPVPGKIPWCGCWGNGCL